MSALVRKDIRLLLPAWITAMLLVIAPIPLGPLFQYFDPLAGLTVSGTASLTLFGLAAGSLLLGLAGFGREMSSRTFSLLLVQPRPRSEYWRAKVGVVVVSLIPLALLLGLVSWFYVLTLVSPSDRWIFALDWFIKAFITACVAVTGGLWTTLLFRQIIASFWIAVLVPFSIVVSVMSLDEELVSASAKNITAIVLLLVYSVAGYLFARWQFLHAQDTAWTGGNVSLPSAARWLPWKRTATALQKVHPLRALLGKEFQFQQINFLLAGLLLVVQVAVLLVQKFVHTAEHSMLDMLVQGFWAIWIVMPLLVGCGVVAEERKLGTLEPQLCLPVARAWQFAVKLFVTLICAIVLGALVPVALAVVHPTPGATGMEYVIAWTLACVCLALVSFYASSLTHQLLQALGTAIGIIVVGLFLTFWFGGSFSRGQQCFSLFGAILWRGPLFLFVGAGVVFLFTVVLTWRRLRWMWMSLFGLIALGLFRGKFPSLFAGGLATDSVAGFKTITVVGVTSALCPVILTLALAAQNFRHTQTSFALWRRNAAMWLGSLVLTGVLTTLIYNRTWELAMQFEPPTGTPRLSGSVQPVITGWFFDQPTFVLLPDGRLCSYKAYERIPPPSTPTNSSRTADADPAWRTIKNPRVEFIGGSNWVAIAAARREFVGVKSDGSLWRVSWFERVDKEGKVVLFHAGSPRQKGITVRKAAIRIERIGDESDWAKVAAGWSHFVALKRNGTIWGWGDNQNKQLGDVPVAATNAPVQIGQAANWTAVYAGARHSYAVNRAGEIWRWGKLEIGFGTVHYKIEEGPVKLNLKVPGVRSIITGDNNFDLILDTDGNFWGLGYIPPALTGGEFGVLYSEPKRLGGTNWLAFSYYHWQALVGLKTDGTLWCQRGGDFYNRPLPKLAQLGKRNDWIAVISDWQADFALAKDGTICRFGDQTLSRRRFELLAPTRRVTWSVNLLNAGK